VGKGEGDAFRVGGDDIDTLTAVVGKGRAKGKGAIFVRDPSVAVFRVREGKAELARGVNRVGGEVERRWRPDQAEREGSGRQERMTLRVISA
jgi:hypothetical protein